MCAKRSFEGEGSGCVPHKHAGGGDTILACVAVRKGEIGNQKGGGGGMLKMVLARLG